MAAAEGSRPLVFSLLALVVFCCLKQDVVGSRRLKVLANPHAPNAVVDRITRHTDLSLNIVVETVTMVVHSADDKPMNTVTVPIEAVLRYGYVETRIEDQLVAYEELEEIVTEESVDYEYATKITPLTFRHFSLAVPHSLRTNRTLNVTVVLYIGLAFEPLPKRIQLKEQQTVVYHGSKFAPSVYPVLNQTRIFAGPGIQGPPLPQSFSGPFEPYTVGDTILLLNELNDHLGAFSYVEREIEVSHWGNVFTQESYEFHNGAASLQGEFSRIELAELQGGHFGAGIGRLPDKSPTVWSFEALFPDGAHGLEYYDKIGNISSSKAARMGSKITARLVPRFPVLGGWNADWMLSYSVPIESVLTVKGQRHTLTFSLAPTVRKMFIENMLVKVVLPPGSRSIQVSPSKKAANIWQSMKSSWFDVLSGRPVAMLSMNDLYLPEEVAAQTNFQVSYDYLHSVSDTQKPLIICLLVLVPFLLYVALGRLNPQIATKEEKEACEYITLLKSLGRHVAEKCEELFLANDELLSSIAKGHPKKAAKQAWLADCKTARKYIADNAKVVKGCPASSRLSEIKNIIEAQADMLTKLCDTNTQPDEQFTHGLRILDARILENIERVLDPTNTNGAD